MTFPDLGVSNLPVWDIEPYYTMLEHDTGDRDSGSAQSPGTLMEASVIFVDDYFVELRITGWGAKGNYESFLFRRRKDLILCLRSPRGLIRRDESTGF